MGCLVLALKEGEEVLIGETIRVYVSYIGPHKIRLSFQAPAHLPILRAELLEDRSVRAADGNKSEKRPPPLTWRKKVT